MNPIAGNNPPAITVFRPPIAGSPEQLKSVVFVHGIFSTAEDAFSEMLSQFRFSDKLSDRELAGFNYDFNRSLNESASRLFTALKAHFAEGDHVVLVCHSMGGLVARLAVLHTRMPFLKRIIMLGTPNLGVLRTSQLGLLATISASSLGSLWGVFSRKTGIRDLTRVNDIFAPLVNDQDSRANADRVEYVTIPGMFFHDSRKGGYLGEREGEELWMGLFSGVNLSVAIYNALTPSYFNIKFDLPNDGIVEESSNRLDPASSAGRRSEKMRAINGLLAPEAPKTYAHVRPTVSDNLIHVNLQHNPQVIGYVEELVLTNSLDAWYKKVLADDDAQFYEIKVY